MVYPDLAGGPKKVVYMPKVDQFMVLQLKGFYKLMIKDVSAGGKGQNAVVGKADDNRVMIMTNKHISRPIVSESACNVQVVMKGNKPALLVNIRITLDQGLI